MPSIEVGKKELAARLNWSRPTLDQRLKTDPNFPVLTRGGRGGGWAFDLEAVRAYLSGTAPSSVDAATDDGAGENDDTPPAVPPAGRVAIHTGEASARQRKDLAAALLSEDRLAEKRGELVQASEVKETFDIVMAEFKAMLSDLPGIIGKEFGLSDRVQHSMRLKIEAAQRSVAVKIRGRLSDA